MDEQGKYDDAVDEAIETLDDLVGTACEFFSSFVKGIKNGLEERRDQKDNQVLEQNDQVQNGTGNNANPGNQNPS